METGNESCTLTDKLSAHVDKIVDKHRDKLSAMWIGDSALAKDENVRRIATFCYPLLPGWLRLAVKEATFVNFVIANREKLLARLMAPAPL